MEDNPYPKILALIRNQATNQIPMTFRFGEVVSTTPLKVEVSKTVQEAEDLLKSNSIGKRHSGDSVLLLPFDSNQKFIILCRVVGV